MKKFIKEKLREEYNHRDYLKWKRNNVTLRGMKDGTMGDEEGNGSGAMLGLGLYTAPLSNKAMAKEYGTVNFVLNAIPKKPLIFRGLNDWEIWIQRNLFMKYSKNEMPDSREFHKHDTVENAIQKMGYDGVIIKGREMVNFSPPENVMYFQNERQLQDYYDDFV